MKERVIRGGILAVSIVSMSLAIGALATTKYPQSTNTQENIIYVQNPVQYKPFPPVDKLVEIVDNYVEPPAVTAPTYTEQQREILAIIIYQEAGGDMCSDDTRRKVGSVFLNRVNSRLFPNTFEEVATANRQYGTLYITGIKWPNRAAYEQEAHAVERAYNIAEELLIGGSILPDNVVYQAEFPQGDGTYCYQDDLYFCYLEVNE